MAQRHFSPPLFVLVGIVSFWKPTHQYGSGGIQISQYPNLMTSGDLPPGYYRLEPGNYVQIQSPNYGLSSYSNADLIWRFSGDGCGINIRCPCFKVPASFQCLGDYLRFTDTVFYNQRFCGDVAPQGSYRTVSGTFKIKFRSDATNRRTGLGFLCYIACTEPGQAEPIPPITDPNSQCFIPAPLPTTTTSTTSSSTTSGTPAGLTSSTSSTSSSSTPITTTTLSNGMVPGLDPTMNRFPSGCWDYWRQIPVGETIRETKPGVAVRPRPPGIPPWCWP